MASAIRILFICFGMLCGSLSWAEEPTAPDPAANLRPAAANSTEEPPAPPSAAARTGIDQPVTLVPATSDEVTVKVLLRNLDARPADADLGAGLLVSTQQPNLMLRPSVEVLDARGDPKNPKDFLVELKITGLTAFGESSAPLLYKGRQVESLRFSKPGLIVKPAGEGGFVARDGSKLSLVLENPLAFQYKSVRARLRFGNSDFCRFEPEKFAGPGGTGEGSSGKADAPCDSYANWTPFDVPRYAQVTLRADPVREWFLDPDTGLARGGKQKGWLTLRFDAGGPIYEQNLPVEIEFKPGTGTLFRSLSCVAMFLALGAILSLVLRVSVPNIKRKRQLKDQLHEAAKLTASISTEVESTLRVLLRVERLALDEIRRAAWAFGPSYADYARRVEQGLPPLMRRIDAARRLDATLIRRRLMMEQGAAPTRLEQIESLLATVSETLKQDQLSDEDWVFVNQRLESAQKTLREPTQTEKEAFDAMLSGRWKAIRGHFDVDEKGELKRPHALSDMEACFPERGLLPAADDEDGTKWIQAVGSVRADLQLSALGLLWEFQFLAPADAVAGSPWAEAKGTLNRLLATPAVDNLREARSLLRQLAEGVSEADIVSALKHGGAMIVMDPPVPRPNQKIRFSVRFRVSKLNAAAARELVTCRWSFRDRHATTLERVRVWQGDAKPPAPKQHPARGRDAAIPALSEDGWNVHHYFEGDVDQSTISVDFFDSAGKPIDIGRPEGGAAAGHWSLRVESVRASRRPKELWAHAWLELFQLTAALSIPLATLASTTLSGGGAAHWWELVAIGFASDTIKSILVGRQESTTST